MTLTATLRKRWRKLLASIGAAIVTLILVAAAIVLFGDLSQFRSQAQQLASRALALPVAIDGDIQVLPTLPVSILVKDVVISNPANQPNKDVARIRELTLRINSLALIQGAVKLESIKVADARLELTLRTIRHLVRQFSANEEAPGGTTNLLSRIDLEDTTIRFPEPSSNQDWLIALDRGRILNSAGDLSIVLNASINDEPLKLDLRGAPGNRWDTQQSPWPVSLSASGDRWGLDAQGQIHSSNVFDLAFELRAESLDPVNQFLKAHYPDPGPFELKAKIGRQHSLISVEDLQIKSPHAEGVGTLVWPLDEQALSADIHLHRLDLGALISGENAFAIDLDDKLPSVLSGQTTTASKLKLQVDRLIVDAQNIADFRLAQTTGENQGKWLIKTGSPELRGSISLQNESARQQQLIVNLQGNALRPLNPYIEPVQFDDDTRLGSSLVMHGQTYRALLSSMTGHIEVLQPGFLITESSPAWLSELSLAAIKLETQSGKLDSLSAHGIFAERTMEIAIASNANFSDYRTRSVWPIQGAGHIGDLRWSANLQADTASSPFALDGSFAIQGKELGQLLPNGNDKLFAFALSGQFSGNQQAFKLTELEAQLAESSLKGLISYAADSAQHKLAGRLHADRVELNQLERLVQAIDAQSRSAGDNRSLDMALDVEVEALSGLAVSAENIKTLAKYRDDSLSLDPLALALDDVIVEGSAKANFKNAQPSYAASVELGQMTYHQLSNLIGVKLPLDGAIGSALAKISTTGATADELMNSLTYSADIRQSNFAFETKFFDFQLQNSRAQLQAAPNDTFQIDISGSHLNQPLSSKLTLDNWSNLLKDKSIELDLSMQSGGTKLIAQGRVNRPLTLEDLNLRVQSQGADLGFYHQLGMVPRTIQGDFELSTVVKKIGSQLRFENMQARLGPSDAAGVVGLPIGEGGRLEASLTSKRVILPDYFEKAWQEDRNNGSDFLIPDLPIANAIPPNWSGQAIWKIGDLSIAQSSFSDVRLLVDMQPGTAKFDYHGVTRGSAGKFRASALVTLETSPTAQVQIDADAFDLGWLLPTEANKETHWPVDVTVALDGPARSLDELLAFATGELSFIAGPSAGAEFDRWELNVVSIMLPTLGAKRKDQISCMVVHLDVEDGLAKGDGAVLETLHAVVVGGGMIDLRTEDLGWYLSATPKDKSLLDLTAALQLGGKLADPKVSVGPGNLALTAGSLILGVANPFSLLNLFSKSSDGNRCEQTLAQTAKQASQGTLGVLRKQNPGGIFDFLQTPRVKSERGGASNQ